MPPPKTILLSATIGIVVYVLLMVPWTGWERKYAALFRAGGNAVFSSRFWIWPQASTHFVDLHSDALVDDINAVLPAPLPRGFKPPWPKGDKDTLLVLQNTHALGSVGFLRTTSQLTGYAPTAMFIVLALATPVALRRRFWILVWGLVLVHVFIAFRLTLFMSYGGFAVAGKRYHLFDPNPFWFDVLGRADTVFTDNPSFCYIVAIVPWVLVLAGLDSWSRWRLRRNAKRALHSAR